MCVVGHEWYLLLKFWKKETTRGCRWGVWEDHGDLVKGFLVEGTEVFGFWYRGCHAQTACINCSAEPWLGRRDMRPELEENRGTQRHHVVVSWFVLFGEDAIPRFKMCFPLRGHAEELQRKFQF